jgi:hypothetical protein
LKKNLTYLAVGLALLAIVGGCAAMAVSPVTGFIMTDVKGPLTATNASSGFSKIGTAECSSILGIIGQGDASIDAAMKNGGITKVHHVDFHSYSILGLYAKYTTVVYGE